MAVGQPGQPLPPRYVRLNPRGALAALHPPGPGRARAVAEAMSLLEESVARVQWLGDGAGTPSWAEVYACDGTAKLAQCPSYRDGSLYGLDAASVFAVCCLGVQPGDRVLDLCCAPGAKLCAAADAAGPTGEVIGVDVAEQRLAVCRALLRKYSVANVRLAIGNGTRWPEGGQWLDLGPQPRGRGQRGRKRKLEAAAAAAATATTDQGAAEPAGDEEAEQQGLQHFDRVLVDAECTHDASLRHLEKYRTQWGWETIGGRVPWIKPGAEADLRELQLGLLRNGFRLLRPGGSLVYSTCSLCRQQNEDVVAALLATDSAAALAPLPVALVPQAPGTVPAGTGGGAAAGTGTAGTGTGAAAVLSLASVAASTTPPARPSLLEQNGPLGEGGRYCTARFDPSASGTSGLFVACLTRKLGNPPPSS